MVLSFSLKGRIFEYMSKVGRPRKYATEEERLAAKRDQCLQYKRQRTGIEKREDISNPGRKVKFDTEDGFVVKFETLDRIRLNTIILTIIVNFKYQQEVNWKLIEDSILEVINDWLHGQKNWDRKNKIYIFDAPELKNTGYHGTVRSFNFQLYLKRNTPPLLNWKETYSELLPLSEVLTVEIKNTLDDEGIELTKRWSNNPKKSTEPASPGSAEP